MKSGNTVEPELWYSRGLRFHRTRCGNCCAGATGYVEFSPVELEAMARRVGLTPQEFLDRHACRRRGWWCLKEILVGDSSDCVFLEREPETGMTCCAIHEVRPSQCRSWPFWPENLQTPEAWRQAGEDCPGIRNGRGKVFSADEIRRLSAKEETA